MHTCSVRQYIRVLKLEELSVWIARELLQVTQQVVHLACRGFACNEVAGEKSGEMISTKRPVVRCIWVKNSNIQAHVFSRSR